MFGVDGRFIECLCMGNIGEDDAHKVFEMIGDVLGRPAPGADVDPAVYVASQTRKLPSGAEYHIHAQSKNADEENGAVVMFFQSGLPGYTGVGDDAGALKRTAAMRVLGGMIKEPLFNTLRTKQQLGYIVSGR